METFIKGSGSTVGFVLVDEKKYSLLYKQHGWMISHDGLL